MIETDKTNIAQNTGLQDCLKSSLELVERRSKLHPCNKTKKNKQTGNLHRQHKQTNKQINSEQTTDNLNIPQQCSQKMTLA